MMQRLKTAYAAFALGGLLGIVLASLLVLGALLAYYDLAIPE